MPPSQLIVSKTRPLRGRGPGSLEMDGSGVSCCHDGDSVSPANSGMEEATLSRRIPKRERARAPFLEHRRRSRFSIYVRIGRRVRDLRTKKGWSQRMLAHYAQIEQAYLARLELGQIETGVIVLERIANALEVSLCYLF